MLEKFGRYIKLTLIFKTTQLLSFLPNFPTYTVMGVDNLWSSNDKSQSPAKSVLKT
jgi:hypothetical protein